MQIQSIKEIKIMVELNEKEALWLRSFIQNYPGDLDNEPQDMRDIRYELFNILNTEIHNLNSK